MENTALLVRDTFLGKDLGNRRVTQGGAPSGPMGRSFRAALDSYVRKG